MLRLRTRLTLRMCTAALCAQLVDFAHVLPAGGARDDNVLRGLRSLIAELEALLPPVLHQGDQAPVADY